MDTPETTPTPDAALAEIAAERSNPDSAFNDGFSPGHEAAVAKMNERYVKLYGRGEIDPGAPVDDQAPPVEAAAPPEAPLPPLAEGHEWDGRAVAELHTVAARDGLAEHVGPLMATVAWAVGQPVPSDDERDLGLSQLWGRELEQKMADADTIWLRLPQRVRRDLMVHHVDRQPAFIQALAEIGGRVLRDPEHPLGIAHMKAKYERALAKDAADRAADEAKYVHYEREERAR
jgi:hypothetical protein